jgi:hypothetical protein
MTTAIKRRRGTTAEHSTFIGLEGEITIDSTKDTVVVHDGSTTGGFPLAKETGSSISAVDLTVTNSYGMRIQAGTTSADTTLLIRDATNTAEYLAVIGNGNVGIGTILPRGVLDISKSDSVNAVQFYLENTSTSEVGLRIRRNASDIGFVGTAAWSITGGGSTNFGINGVNALVFGVGSTERARIDSSGNVGIGTSAPTDTGAYGKALDVQGSGGSAIYVRSTTSPSTNYGYVGFTSGAGNLDIWNNPAGAIRFYNNGSERARIDSSGNLLVGTTSVGISNTNGLTIEGASGFQTINHGNGSPSGKLYIQFGYYAGAIGSITQSGTTAVLYNTTSDQRLKENIVDADSASVLIDSLQVRQFDWKSENSHQRYGFVAQELVNVAPEAVHQPADPEEMMAVDYSKLVPMLVKEIQSLRQRLAAAGI